jgi:large subunit ribosomal protein L7Ae
VLYKRLKVPPSINQFRNTLDKNGANQLFKLLNKYKPEDKAEKKARLLTAAKAEGKPAAGKKPLVVKYGINHVTALVEAKKAKLVVSRARRTCCCCCCCCCVPSNNTLRARR